MIRIGIDAQIAGVSRAGIGQYTAALLAWLPRIDLNATYVPFRPVRRGDFSMPQRWWWDQVAIPKLARRAKIDVLLKTGFSVPVRSPVPVVATLHDLAARRFPSQLHRPSAWFYGRWVPWTMRFAKRVIAISKFTANEGRSLLHIPAERLTAIMQGGDEESSPQPQPEDRAVAERFHLPDKFILHVGTIEPRKNIPFLLRAFARFQQRRREYALVLAGARGWKSGGLGRLVRELGLTQSVIMLGSVTDQERRVLYRLSRAFAFPSSYEGFGRPPLEAMAAGTPVVAAATSSIPEVVGDAGLLIPEYDERIWAEALHEAAENESRRQQLRQAGLRRSREFSWERACQQIAAILHEAAQ